MACTNANETQCWNGIKRCRKYLRSKKKNVCFKYINYIYFLVPEERMKLKETACRSVHVSETHILLLFTALAERGWLVNVLIRVPLALICRGLLQRGKSRSLSPPCTQLGHGPGTTPHRHHLLSKHLSPRIQWSDPGSLHLQFKMLSMLHSSHSEQILNHPGTGAICPGPKRNDHNAQRPKGRQQWESERHGVLWLLFLFIYLLGWNACVSASGRCCRHPRLWYRKL